MSLKPNYEWQKPNTLPLTYYWVFTDPSLTLTSNLLNDLPPNLFLFNLCTDFLNLLSFDLTTWSRFFSLLHEERKKITFTPFFSPYTRTREKRGKWFFSCPEVIIKNLRASPQSTGKLNFQIRKKMSIFCWKQFLLLHN